MATLIVESCIGCGVCEDECPNGAIRAGEDLYVINPERCTECVGFHAEEQCAKVCPIDACLPDPDRDEDEDVLVARAKRIHPQRPFAAPMPSRFR